MAAELSELQQLCTGCAKCCAGGMFGATSLETHEEERFGCRALPQPCPYLARDRSCSIYATRPKACVAFLCEPAMLLKRGAIDLDEAKRRAAALPVVRVLPVP